MYTYHNFFIHSSVIGHLGCFHVLAIVNNSAMVSAFNCDLSFSIERPPRRDAGMQQSENAENFKGLITSVGEKISLRRSSYSNRWSPSPVQKVSGSGLPGDYRGNLSCAHIPPPRLPPALPCPGPPVLPTANPLSSWVLSGNTVKPCLNHEALRRHSVREHS